MESQQKENFTPGGELAMPGNPLSEETGPTDSGGGHPSIVPIMETTGNYKTNTENGKSGANTITRAQAEAKYIKLLGDTQSHLEALEAAVQAASNTKLDIKTGIRALGICFREFQSTAKMIGMTRSPDATEQRVRNLQHQQQTQHAQTLKLVNTIREEQLQHQQSILQKIESLTQKQQVVGHGNNMQDSQDKANSQDERLAFQDRKLDKIISDLDLMLRPPANTPKQRQHQTREEYYSEVLKGQPQDETPRSSHAPNGNPPTSEWKTVTNSRKTNRRPSEGNITSSNTRRHRSPRNGKGEEVRTRNRSDVVIVQTNPENYTEVLKKIKSGVNMEAIGNKISAMRQTRSGGILIKVSGGSPAADVVRAEVSKIVETDTLIRAPKQQSLVEFRGLDSLTNIDELVTEIVLNADTPREAVKVLNMRKTYGETQSALVLMPWDNATKITKIGRIRVGLVYCSTRLCKKRIRCFRCLKFGHESRTCSGPDKSSCCRRCGVPDHLAVDCKASTEDAADFRRSLTQDPQPTK